MSARRAIMLTARREVSERLRSRSYQLSTAGLVAIVVAIVVVVGLLDDDGPSRFEVATAGAEAAAITAAAGDGQAAFELELETLAVEDENEAVALVEDDEVDAALVGEGRILADGDPPDELVILLQAAAREVRGAELLREEGLGDAAIEAALEPPALAVAPIDDTDEDGEGLALLSAILLFMAIMTGGLAVSSGVVEEKGSRVIELLLSAIKPIHLLAGKVIGIGLVGLSQIFALVAAGIAAALLFGGVELPPTTTEAAVLAPLFFILGYLLYACAFAVAGAIVSRQEDLQGSTSLLTVILTAAYLASFGAIGNPTSSFAVAITLIPLTAPIVAPVRAVQGALPAVELVAAIALTLAAALLLLWLAARIYDRAVLHMGRPLKLREALRAER